MLDRIGDEIARATSIVRYGPGSRFPPHSHDGGEEFLVLDGVFEDDNGSFPAGTYVRNPPGSRHAPGSKTGCTIFVKLWQFDPADRHEVSLDTNVAGLEPVGERPGVTATELSRDHREIVRVECWADGATVTATPVGGLEILCLAGGFVEGGETFTEQSWLRLPQGAALIAEAGPKGCRVWLKEGHLRFVGEDRRWS